MPEPLNIPSEPLEILASGLERVRCGVCGASESRHLFAARDYIYGNAGEWPVAQCSDCGVVFMNPRIPPGEIGAYYPRSYYTNEVAVASKPTGWKRQVRNALLGQCFGYSFPSRAPWLARGLVSIVAGVMFRFDAVQHYIQWVPGGRVLDVGCGNGSALTGYRSLGWITEGSEIGEASASVAMKAGHKIFVGELSGANYSTNFFDAVTLWDALEHIHNPRETLAEIWRVLKPGGRVYISVPNAGSIYWRVLKDKWFMFTSPLHYFHYTPATLERLLTLTGFEVVRTLSTCGHAGISPTLDILARSQPLIRILLKVPAGRWILRKFDLIAPWGHLVGVGRKPLASHA